MNICMRFYAHPERVSLNTYRREKRFEQKLCKENEAHIYSIYSTPFLQALTVLEIIKQM
jgi:hypothetical protein